MDKAFRAVLAILFAGFIVHRGYYTRKVQHSTDSVLAQPEPGDLTRIANVLSVPALLSTIVYLARPEWLSWAAFPLPRRLRWLGVGTALSGFGLLQWSQIALGRNWSDAPKLVAAQQVVDEGPYRQIRHPIYAAFLLILGSALPISANWLVGGLWIVTTGLDVVSRMNTEEAMLLGRFADDYRAYMRRTGRVFPRLAWSRDREQVAE